MVQVNEIYMVTEERPLGASLNPGDLVKVVAVRPGNMLSVHQVNELHERVGTHLWGIRIDHIATNTPILALPRNIIGGDDDA